MSKREPQALTFEMMQEFMAKHGDNGMVIVADDIAIIYRSNLLSENALEMGVPYRFANSRVVFVASGEAELTNNLMTFRLHEGMVAFFRRGSIAQINSMSADFSVDAIVFDDNHISSMGDNKLYRQYQKQVTDDPLYLNDNEAQLADGFFMQLWKTIKFGIYNRELLISQVASLFHFFDVVHERHLQADGLTLTRAEQLLRRFLHVVSEHHASQRSLHFYADKLCITDKYLCLVVRQVSGFTPKEWIDRALVTHAKMLLRSTDRPVAIISEELNFPYSSSFCKFFKRMTDCTPQEYRERK